MKHPADLPKAIKPCPAAEWRRMFTPAYDGTPGKWVHNATQTVYSEKEALKIFRAGGQSAGVGWKIPQDVHGQSGSERRRYRPKDDQLERSS